MTTSRDLSELVDLTNEMIQRKIFRTEFGHELGAELTVMIRTRVRLGYGVNFDGIPKRKFRKLKKSTIAYRESLAKNGTLSSLTQPKMANMTRFGTMMDDLTYRVAPSKVIILFNDDKEIEKAYYNEQLGRRFMFLSPQEIRAAKQVIQKALDSYVDEIASYL
jgi:hypothetical protein